MGVVVLEQYLIISARAAWSRNAGKEFNAPSLVYDYQRNEIVQKFASGGQTVSVAVMDEHSHVLVGAGGQAGFTGQPNLLFDVHYMEEDDEHINEEDGEGGVEERVNKRGRILKHMRDKMEKGDGKAGSGKGGKAGKAGKGPKPPEEKGILNLQLSDPQLAIGMPLNYSVYKSIDHTPVSTQEYFVVPSPGLTRTRQVLPFDIDNDACLVLEINSAQTCNIYHRNMWKESASKVMPLPGSEGFNNVENQTYMYARAGDTLLVGDQLYVIIAQYNANNTVYSFSTKVF